MRFCFFMLVVVCSLSIKAQSGQSGRTSVHKHVYTAQEIDERENDTTGKYRIGIPPKRVIDAANKKAEAEKNQRKDTTSNNSGTKPDSTRLKEKAGKPK